uniref:Homing endonuclease n=1 Tax=Siphoviridae sp. ctqSm5 TaxID=2827949 RepID=A0A8S5SNT9_9CAUD|nr:MAG TPA: homing endonuclease [Siphoviridae sp. ctqSm5]
MESVIIIKESHVQTSWNAYTREHYINKGYTFTKYGDKFEVKIEDLPQESTVTITRVCPNCNNEKVVKYRNITRAGHSYCNKCSKSVRMEERMSKKCCSYCGEKSDCYRYIDGLPYCNRHASQMQNYSKCFKSIYEANDIELKEEWAEIVLRNRQGEEVARALIDIEDIDKVTEYKWRLYENYHTDYVYGSKGGVTHFKLHRVIMSPPKHMVVDHINHNGLDNRKTNLRVVTHSENGRNKITHKPGLWRKWREDGVRCKN